MDIKAILRFWALQNVQGSKAGFFCSRFWGHSIRIVASLNSETMAHLPLRAVLEALKAIWPRRISRRAAYQR